MYPSESCSVPGVYINIMGYVESVHVVYRCETNKHVVVVKRVV